MEPSERSLDKHAEGSEFKPSGKNYMVSFGLELGQTFQYQKWPLFYLCEAVFS